MDPDRQKKKQPSMCALQRSIMKALGLLILVTFLCLAQQCGGAPIPQDAIQDDELRRKIDDFVDTLMVEERMIGLTLAVTKDGQPFMTRGYGTTTLGGNVSVTSDTLFYLDSCTKAFTATLLVMLLDRNERYSLESNVQDIYPDFHVQEIYRCKHASLRDILSQRVGYYDSPYSWLFGEVTERKELIRRARYQGGSEPFRGAETYNHIMYTVAGEVAGLLKGASFEDTMLQELLRPLGMTETTFMYEAKSEQRRQMATPYETGWASVELGPVSMELFSENLRLVGPASALLTNSNDMQKWLAVLSNRGLKQDGSRLISQDVLEETMMGTSYAFALPPPQGNGSLTHKYLETGAALGWHSGLYRGYRMATHAGYLLGFQSLVTVLPDSGAGVYIGINVKKHNPAEDVMKRIANYVFDIFMGFENETLDDQGPSAAKPYVKSSIGQEPSGMKSAESDGRLRQNELMSDFEGIYGHLFIGNITIYFNTTDGLLHGKFGSLGEKILQSMGNDSFVGLGTGLGWFAPPIWIYFSRPEASKDGKFEKMSIPHLYPYSPPTFTRDLRMDDAPPHGDDVTSSHGRWSKPWRVISSGLATITLFLVLDV